MENKFEILRVDMLTNIDNLINKKKYGDIYKFTDQYVNFIIDEHKKEEELHNMEREKLNKKIMELSEVEPEEKKNVIKSSWIPPEDIIIDEKKIKCGICGKIITKNNKSKHCESKFHMNCQNRFFNK